jgi:hypothetical protein
MRRYFIFSIAIACALSLTSLKAYTFQTQVGALTGTVKDPKGAVVVGAQISIRNAAGETRTATTDGEGRFKFESLASGSYDVNAKRAGFKTAERRVNIESGKTASLEIKLEIAETKDKVTVGAKGTIAPNADPNYRALCDGVPNETYTVSNLTLKRDVGVITLRSGSVSFLPPVLAEPGVFAAQRFSRFDPALATDRPEFRLHRLYPGSHRARSCASMVGSHRRLGIFPQSMAERRFRGFFRQSVSAIH